VIENYLILALKQKNYYEQAISEFCTKFEAIFCDERHALVQKC